MKTQIDESEIKWIPIESCLPPLEKNVVIMDSSLRTITVGSWKISNNQILWSSYPPHVHTPTFWFPIPEYSY